MNTCYLISAEAPFDEPCYESVKTNEPKEAIEKWFDFGRKYPMCANIQCATNEDAKQLLLYANENQEYVRSMYDKGCPYKWDWILNGIQQGIKSKRPLLQWDMDSVFPFCMG